MLLHTPLNKVPFLKDYLFCTIPKTSNTTDLLLQMHQHIHSSHPRTWSLDSQAFAYTHHCAPLAAEAGEVEVKRFQLSKILSHHNNPLQ